MMATVCVLGPRWRTCVVKAELDAVRFTLKRVVSDRVVVLICVYQRHTVRSTHPQPPAFPGETMVSLCNF